MAVMKAILLAVFILGAAWVVYSSYCLYRNYLEALKIGVPVRIIPISHLNKVWLLIDKRVIFTIRRLPGVLGRNNFTRFNYRGWHEDDRTQAHDEMGEAFVLVTPSHNWLYIAEPEALMNMYRRGKDFPRWTEITSKLSPWFPCNDASVLDWEAQYINTLKIELVGNAESLEIEMLDVFGGPNIATSSGEQWRMQRKIVNSCLNEKCNSLVWSEAALLGDQMAQYWATKGTFTTVGEDTRTTTLHILTKACFGQSLPFEGHDTREPASPSASFRFSLVTIMENALLILALRPRFFTNKWLLLPKTWRDIGVACTKFKGHMSYLYDRTLRASAQDRLEGDSTLMASMIRASLKNGTEMGLSEGEIYGTMFVISFAGHDTTAHLLTFAIFFLAANPLVQDWLAQELRRVLGDRPIQEWDYHADFPRLIRCMAILYETLRVKTPVPEVKWTKNRPQTLVVGSKTLDIPPETLITPSYIYVHNHSRFWGPDAQEWKPQRWVTKFNQRDMSPSQKQEERNKNLGDKVADDYMNDEILLPPPSRGNYLGWSEGARDCPGKRFSQVEWVAIIATLFRDWKVEPSRSQDETAMQAQTKVFQLIKENTGYGGLLLQLRNPESIPLTWTARAQVP
ncbi:hypothetical protein NUW58_g1783 [Xylaria curta]|uniref:Uncharacterized protein n=2 Tax=Xylaria curta TaxID=42375 RepID=A0ACC1N4W3_9PEZI|nr:hypothetical protein NUW58_g8708 [Xylaria curta]KAJ2993624.1 hypothetical protein NUW58_g1783 [Xylaria curta]